MVKVTYTLDDETVERIRRIAGRLGKPQSMVVREAVKDYEARSDKLSEEERTRLLAALDAAMAKLPPRPRSEIDAELAEIRRARRHGGRRHRAE
ncbi:MAG: ribbon-helix-helix protein, CopG family [Candidatus Rokubacteria bacterium]|nr:ribbon-helix-helix protein, CopG family [Candidatus Rokubacteria bacterium]